MGRLQILLALLIALTGCGVSKSAFSPVKKYSPQQLERDYSLYQHILEQHHPSLYWYTSKDSMDLYFMYGRQQLKDSMTEPEFRKLLSYVTAKINCGHTSIRNSKAWSKYSDTVRLGKMFPLSMKVWNDTMLVTANLNRKDSILKRGTMITRINGKDIPTLTDTLFEYISTDGYNRTHKYQSLSNRGYFGSLYTLLYGPSEKYTLDYIDSTGQQKSITIPIYNPAADTAGRMMVRPPARIPRPSKRERRRQQISTIRLLRIDTVNHSAMMTLSTFGRGYGLKKFFRQSFRALQQKNITHLIVDVRGNGGGSVNNSTQLTRYIARQPFKISDSLFAIRKRSNYEQYIQHHFWNKLFITLFTRRRNDGNYHFGYFERHYFRPKKNNHYNGKVYIVTGGNSFSATTLFTGALVKQNNVIVVGEETGGGAYGNSAWLIPYATLPETGVRFRLPLFRLVIDKTVPKNGRGVQPEITSFPSIEAIRRNADFKIETVMELIQKDKEEKKN
ncbi:MAG TPA: S41 family peptidase [Chitinophagaceae bacterium]|nr:S41 family peptidase [Chitinophagaceae bacterium]HQZ73975.1 S41 family peptidase [Chitinophagaceae bacterium]